ncbi:related to cell cycle checkpoint protein RAD17 [Cephalotrichum gorgonifer]|uniref:Related to cell cycle checkpoint protein RAD17 n=1 Tax=Cephalotrichum gorgonifer TaxID=2041049 RepID=A0AAE8MPQ4_9PEZI|nr:related to cell cycle checkpoint protein RAD17 [Cephalotrichum gorgonifer]
MAPAAKRRRKNVADSSDEDEPDRRLPQDNMLTRFLNSSPNPKGGASAASSRPPTASPSPLKKSRNGPNLSPSASPSKSRARSQKKVKVEEKGKSGDLLTLFSKQVQRSQAASTVPKTTPIDEVDPISDDDDVSYFQAHSGSIVGEKARKRLRDGSQGDTSSATTRNPSQLFVRPTRPGRPGALDDDLRPWSERFGPVNLDELAVHKKKVADVRRWIEGVTQGTLRQRILLLKGAAGTGKTTTVRLLAREMGCELLEWRSPTQSFVPGMQSPSAQFEAFLGLGGKFGGLEIDSDTPENQKNQSEAAPATQRIILIEEFPNTFTRASTSLASFRNALSAYLSENTPSLMEFSRRPLANSVTPIILVVSETLLTTTSASADSFTAHRLLGPDIIRHPGTGTIEFNSIAPSLLTKALELVVLKEARKSGRRRTPGPQVLKRLGEIGDIRSAISSLEFLCLKGDEDGDWGARVTFAKPKRGAKGAITLTQGEVESLGQISERESSLGIFHAVGKVVYNKRDEAPTNDSVEVLPDYLRHHARPKRSQVSVDTLIDETGSDTSTFISALYENYVLSCETADPHQAAAAAPLDHLNGCIEALSDSDLLSPSWDSFFGGRGGGAYGGGRDVGSHIVRQDEMGFQVAVRGVLFALPHPVKRVASGPGRGADAFKMFYPTSIKLWRAKEEMEALIDVWSTKLLSGTGADARGSRSVTDGASLFLRAAKNNPSLPPPSGTAAAAAQGRGAAAEDAPAPLLSLGSAARRELLLDRLPYMAHLSRSRTLPLRARDLEKVVSFGGLGLAAGDEEAPDDEEAEAGGGGETWATDRPHEGRSPRKRSGGIRVKGGDGAVARKIEKLVLSDDDIED